MYGMYMLREEEMKLTLGRSVQKKLLFHVTTESRAMESLDSGLDWRRTRRNKYGCGVSFSDDVDYANFYADKFTSEGIIILYIINVYLLGLSITFSTSTYPGLPASFCLVHSWSMFHNHSIQQYISSNKMFPHLKIFICN